MATVHGGLSARIQIAVLRVVALLTKPWGFRGLQRISWMLGAFFPERNCAIISNVPGNRLKIYLNDGYWTRHIFTGFDYEPEVESILQAVISEDSIFFDCGSNIGYWSLVVSQTIHDPVRIIAIEPSYRTYQRLLENLVLNEHCATAVRAAAHHCSGDRLTLITHPKRHVGDTVAGTRRKDAHSSSETVYSIALDDLIEGHPEWRGKEVVIKVDVEEAEVGTLQGARNAIADGALVIYEEHGQDATCRVTEYVLDELKLLAFFLRPNGALVQVTTIAPVQAFKVDSTKGYTMLAGIAGSQPLERVLRRFNTSQMVPQSE